MIGLAELLAVAPLAGEIRCLECAGLYDGSQMEIAAALELGSDGRFRYGMSYGALDEQAEGVWTSERGRILLTSDPFSAPEFRLAEESAAPAGAVEVTLDLAEGLPPGLFDVVLRFVDGEATGSRFADAVETVAFDPARPPASVQIALPMFEILSPPVALSGREGYALRFVFEPNDLGYVAFASTPLEPDQGDLLLERHKRTIRFRKVAP